MSHLVEPRPNIALMGKARSGKDTVASYLCDAYGYTRVAFADPLKEMARSVDPYVYFGTLGAYRLSDIVNSVGWEGAKRDYPEARRFLQELGQGQRAIDPDYWLRIGLRKVEDARSAGRPVVVTDCRYANEYDALWYRGFQMVRVHRQGAGAGGSAASHSSECEADRFHANLDIHNDGSLDDLYRTIDHHAAA